MSTAINLIGVGLPPEAARRVGVAIISVTAAGTTQAAGTALKGPGNLAVLLTTASGESAFVLPANAELGDEVHIFALNTTAPLAFPPTGGTINNGAANASLACPAGAASTADAGIVFTKMSATNWRTVS